jgi:hypothetical protein
MKSIKQISVYRKNNPGKFAEMIGILAKNKINILAFMGFPSGKYDVVKIIVSKPELAYKKLKEKKFNVYMKEVLPMLVKDKPGGLYELVKAISKNSIYRGTAYPLILKERKKTYIIADIEDVGKIKKLCKY